MAEEIVTLAYESGINVFDTAEVYAAGKWVENPGIILGMGLTNERRCYIGTPSSIGRANTQNDPWGTVHVKKYTVFSHFFVHMCYY